MDKTTNAIEELISYLNSNTSFKYGMPLERTPKCSQKIAKDDPIAELIATHLVSYDQFTTGDVFSVMNFPLLREVYSYFLHPETLVDEGLLIFGYGDGEGYYMYRTSDRCVYFLAYDFDPKDEMEALDKYPDFPATCFGKWTWPEFTPYVISLAKSFQESVNS